MSEDGARSPFAHYLEQMRQRGFHPSRRLGQNFLLDPSLHDCIATLAGLCRDDVALEVGAGLGFLTRALLARADRVVAVEIDRRLLEILRAERPRMPGGGQGLHLVAADALHGGRISAEVEAAVTAALSGGRRLVLAANLPYAIAGPLLAELCALPQPPARGAVLVQLELAERLCSAPGSAAYGALSAVVQALYACRLERRVGRNVFRPRPRVDSAICELAPAPAAPLAGAAATERRSYAGFVRQLFSQRRKTLRNALRTATVAAGLEMPALSEDLAARRAVELGAADLVALWRRARGS